MFGFLNRGQPSPLTLRLRHIDIELAKLRAVEDRTPYTWAAIDHWLDRRLRLRPAQPADVPVIPGLGITRPKASEGGDAR